MSSSPAPDLHPRLLRHAQSLRLRAASDDVFAVAISRRTNGLHRIAQMEATGRQPVMGIVADFVGYDAPDHFAPHDALFYRLMQGELGTAKAPGKLRRYRIDLRAKTLREEIVDAGSHEFPMIDPRAALQKHAIGYLTF